ncbi:MAG TPA: AbrB/MazE/SpoVT family DNA-binding domain-containing protein [Candidatus Nanoarchaeia archaeon]|nr:AbrB/MazE/SpoVT family DNA-binding domain-containing protein [Candidatus Nanoarchaeia archaeon]
MDLDKLIISCECGGKMEKITTTVKGHAVRGWKCSKCHEELIHPEDAQKVIEMERARKKNLLSVKLRKVGKSTVVTVPMPIMEAENLKEGQRLEWRLDGGKMMLVREK